MVASDTITERVREHYAAVAGEVLSGGGCCGDSCGCDPVSTNLYQESDVALLPEEAVMASLGCGNPTALANLHEGETVLDLGSGGGIDVLLSARRVGPTGVAYGLDMTDEMLSLAEANKAKAGIENAIFVKGRIDDIPLASESVDVIISNCVINLAEAKAPVLREGFRVLKPGGRFAVSDVVVIGDLPTQVRSSMEAWAGCVAGALGVDEYRALLGDAGFEDIEVEVTRRYEPAESGLDLSLPDDSALASAFIRARKAL